MTKVQVVSDDITRVKADALITTINSQGVWYSEIDGFIQNVSGNLFHSQPMYALINYVCLSDGETVTAFSYGRSHKGEFTNVIFVIDGLTLPLHKIVYNDLNAANVAGFKSVSLPIIRMDVINKIEVVNEIAMGVKMFLKISKLESITFVIDKDPKTLAMLETALK